MILQSFAFCDGNTSKIAFLFESSIVIVNAMDMSLLFEYSTSYKFRKFSLNRTCDTLAIGTSDKFVIVLDINSKDELAKFKIENSITGIIFSPVNSRCFFVADNGGQITQIDLSLKSSSLLLSHFSTVTGVATDFSGKFIFSTDRDGKVRVSKYPDAFQIETYLLAHSAFISKILVLHDLQADRNILVCGGLDKFLTIWNIDDMTLEAKIDYSSLISDSKDTAVLDICSNGKVIYFILENSFNIFSCSKKDSNEWMIQTERSFPTQPFTICIDSEDSLWVSFDSAKNYLFKDELPISTDWMSKFAGNSKIGPILMCIDRYSKCLDKETSQKRKKNES